MLFLLETVEMLLIGLGLAYFTIMTVLGLAFCRRSRRHPAPPPSPADMPEAVYFLLPALNEEAVIGATVHRILADQRSRLVLVDDASEDETGEIARRAAAEISAEGRLFVHRRELPEARLGKGPALNAGYKFVERDARDRGLDPARVVVCVMDADGRLSEGALDAVLPLFADPQVGGVQLAVRIRNRDSFLTRIQDMEFWALSAISQYGRVSSGTVSLGGNGQFTRLSALQSIGLRPWASALTEDLELALELAIGGWRLTSTTGAYVDQQAITTLRPLVRQRTRWFQGHIASIRHVPRIWTSTRLGHAASMELIMYLMIPWALVLPWSIVFHLSLVWTIVHMADHGGLAAFGATPTARAQTLLQIYCESFFPNIAAGIVYRRRDRSISWPRAILLGNVLFLTNYIAYTACWRALVRYMRGHTTWSKTRREAEPLTIPAPTHEALLTTTAAELDVPIPRPELPSAASIGEGASIGEEEAA